MGPQRGKGGFVYDARERGQKYRKKLLSRKGKGVESTSSSLEEGNRAPGRVAANSTEEEPRKNKSGFWTVRQKKLK